MDSHEVGKKELCKRECDPHSITRTRTLKGGWFGLTMVYNCFMLQILSMLMLL